MIDKVLESNQKVIISMENNRLKLQIRKEPIMAQDLIDDAVSTPLNKKLGVF